MLELANKAIEQTNGSPRAYVARGTFLVGLGRFDEAQADLRKGITPDHDSFDAHYRHALQCLRMNDKSGYRPACIDFLNQLRDSNVAVQAYYAAKASVIVPDALSDYAPALALARVAVNRNPQVRRYWVGLGAVQMRAVQMRAGHCEQALASLDRADRGGKSGDSSSAYAQYFRAMVEHHLDRHQDALRTLAHGIELAEQELGDEANPSTANRRLLLEMLRAEAESLIIEGRPH